MKRFLILALTVVVSCSLFVIPTFASESLVYSVEYLNQSAPIELSAPLNGFYIVNFYDDDGQVVLSLGAQDFTYPNTVSFGEGSEGPGDWWELNFYYSDNVLMLETSFGGCTEDDCGTFSLFYPEVSTFELVPYIPVEPDPEPAPSNFLADIGTFFTSAISWFGNVASFIVSRPVFLVALAMPIIGFAVGLFSRIKNL